MLLQTGLGHSVKIAEKHYLQVTEEHLQRALEYRTKTDFSFSNDVNSCSQTSNPTKSIARKHALSASAGGGNGQKMGENDISIKKQKQAVTSSVCNGLRPVSTGDGIDGVFSKNGVADGEGFEPTVRSPVRRFSRPVP